jgi:phage terminase small subunit
MRNKNSKIMKSTIFVIVLLALFSVSILSSCNSSAEKVENAEQDVTEANAALEKANEEYLEDIKSYRIQTAKRIEANNKSIADFNKRIANEKKEAKVDYEKQIAELDQKNTDMQKRMDDYTANNQSGWEKFKSDFNRDMDALGQAFEDLMTKDTK